MTLSWQHIQQFIEQHQLQDKTLYVALSGGADSLCLLYLFHELKLNTGLQFSAIHINHGLSPNAEQWQAFNQQQCKKLNIPFISQQVELNKKNRQSLEQVAREARYQAISEQLNNDSVLFTGHHLADQFETFVLRLMRGSGLAGLTAMKPVTRYPNKLGRDKGILLARPLLTESKQELLEYLTRLDSSWIEDESNADQNFDRNYVRHEILPQFESRWPTAAGQVATSIGLLQQDSQLLNQYVQQDLEQVVELGYGSQLTLNADKLLSLDGNKQGAVLRMFIHQQTGQYPSRNALQQIFDTVLTVQNDNKAQVKCGDFDVRIHQRLLYLVPYQLLPAQALKGETGQFEFDNNPLYSSLEISGLSSWNSLQVTVEFNQPNAKFIPNQNSGSKTIAKWLKEQGCPSWYRPYVPVIYLAGECIGVGEKICNKYDSEITANLVLN